MNAPISSTKKIKSQRFRVRLGFLETVIQAADPAQAVQLARRQLALEMPRHWDMIYSAQPARFQVERLER